MSIYCHHEISYSLPSWRFLVITSPTYLSASLCSQPLQPTLGFPIFEPWPSQVLNQWIAQL